MNYVEVAPPFFILAMGLEYAYGRWVKRQTYRFSDTINSLQMGVLSRLVDVLRIGFGATLIAMFIAPVGLPQWTMQSAWQWIVAFVAYDFCYYWKHRYGHEWRILWASHAAHHQSEEFNLSTALRQTGTDYIGFVFYIPLFFIGIPAPALITIGSLNLIYQFWVHTEHIRRLGQLEWILVTPSNHRVHHARNPEYIDKNYAGVFIVWDRLFGTFQDERADLPCEYGVTGGLRSWNPLWANVHVWWDTAVLAWRTRSIADKFKIWFMPPAWMPPDLATPPKAWHAPKFDPPAPRSRRVYALIQFWTLLFASLWLLKAQNALPRALTLSLFAWFCFSFFAQGAALENRRFAVAVEWARIGAAVAIAFWAQAQPLYDLDLFARLAALYAAASALAMWLLGKQSAAATSIA